MLLNYCQIFIRRLKFFYYQKRKQSILLPRSRLFKTYLHFLIYKYITILTIRKKLKSAEYDK